MTSRHFEGEVLGLGRRGLHALRRALERDLGENAAGALQEAGFAAGDQVYATFRAWLLGYAKVEEPGELDASRLTEVLAAFFDSLGWGTVHLETIGHSGLALDSADWAEAEPGANAQFPSCFVSTGLLAHFLGRVAERDIAVMELECRSRNDARCRFLAGSAATLQRVYDAMNAGEDYEAMLAQ